MDNSNGAPGANTTPADSARRIKEAATNVIDRGREAARVRVSEGADRARSSAQNASGALRKAALDVEEDAPMLGTGLRKAAELLDRATDQIGSGDLTRVVDGVNDFARRQPALFLGASLALGFVIARLGRAAIESAGEHGQADGEYRPITSATPDVTPGL